MSFLERMRAFDADGNTKATMALAEGFRVHTHRVAQTYPDAYFESGRRESTSLEGLANRLFERCTRAMRRKPCDGRTVVRTVMDDGMTSDDALRLIFYGRYSILRDMLRSERDKNLRTSDALEQDDQWKRVGAVLRARATRAPGRVGRQELWQMEVEDPSSLSPLEHRVWSLLRSSQRPLTQASIVNELFPPVGAAPRQDGGDMPISNPESFSLPDQLAVRRAVAAAWDRLSTEDQALLDSIVHTHSQRQVLIENPRFRSAATLNDTIRRVGRSILNEVAAQTGGGEAPNLPAAEMAEIVFDVLTPILEARQSRSVHRHGGPRTIDLGAILIESAIEPSVEALLEALFHPALAAEIGLADELLAWLGDVAWQAAPRRARAEAEYDEGLWVQDTPILDD